MYGNRYIFICMVTGILLEPHFEGLANSLDPDKTQQNVASAAAKRRQYAVRIRIKSRSERCYGKATYT
ncbi:hypothetical protein DPMN_017249 [Dreissena polymorpha]|uniref:Uncharacterized protein n=1 Tax=Dreissena polymorpha TaxID=45954 RepID=A0A9D4NEC5_DREPO|nr:hypothetical protein DPMN_017249 [Dreissena polymorpha]